MMTGTKEEEKFIMNEGLQQYQEALRQQRLADIDKAINTLRESGLKITKKAIAEEIGVSVQTMNKDYIKAYLLSYPEFNSDLPLFVDHAQQLKELEEELIVTNAKLQKTTQRLKETTSDLITIKQRYKELDDKYRHLLGAYQQEVGSKLISF